MGSLLIVVIKLSSIKYADVRNLQEFEYFYDYLSFSEGKPGNMGPTPGTLYPGNFLSMKI